MAYARACREVGKELGVTVCDFWAWCMTGAGWEPGDPLPGSKAIERSAFLEQTLSDGLHLSPEGYGMLFEATMLHITRTWPDQGPNELNFVHPPWQLACSAEVLHSQSP